MRKNTKEKGKKQEREKSERKNEEKAGSDKEKKEKKLHLHFSLFYKIKFLKFLLLKIHRNTNFFERNQLLNDLLSSPQKRQPCTPNRNFNVIFFL